MKLKNLASTLQIFLFISPTQRRTVVLRLRLRLLCGAGGYPPNVLQPFETYCTNPVLVSPFISRGAPRLPA
jgi:hypothetical protein